MRYNNGAFISGILAGMALGAILVIALTPQTRQPMMQGMGRMGQQMRRMWRDGVDAVADAMPGEPD
ncbi:MAG: hypothetical protein AB2385_16550 [Symbiobacterium sp.]|jgi:hypothetical protein|uniref:hypothetical protein n=1 Tax=Symbiobacterium sp. TaxID=1971213 RepID=UPI0034646985